MIIKESDLFKGVSIGALEKIASLCREKAFGAGEVIFRRGDPAESFYVLQEGQVDVFVSGQGESGIHFVMSTPGDLFGFMALAEPPVHVATATAISRVKAVQVPMDAVQRLIDSPTSDALVFLRNLVTLLAKRLRRAYGLVAEEVARETAPEIKSYG